MSGQMWRVWWHWLLTVFGIAGLPIREIWVRIDRVQSKRGDYFASAQFDVRQRRCVRSFHFLCSQKSRHLHDVVVVFYAYVLKRQLLNLGWDFWVGHRLAFVNFHLAQNSSCRFFLSQNQFWRSLCHCDDLIFKNYFLFSSKTGENVAEGLVALNILNPTTGAPFHDFSGGRLQNNKYGTPSFCLYGGHGLNKRANTHTFRKAQFWENEFLTFHKIDLFSCSGWLLIVARQRAER